MATRRVQIGSVVSGKYRLIERLGGGGMGEVYRAEHELAGRIVALKLLKADFAEDEELTRRFFREAQAVNKIRHPNIVDVLDAGFSEEGPYVAMECLEGTSLSGALTRVERLDQVTALAVVLPMLDALDSAHRQGIVHRDLKPENVFLARYGDTIRVKIVDFGIAKMTTSGTEGAPQTHTGVIFGTPDYLSPEQASGDGLIDGRSDIFAVGIVLFELLTGRRPFEAKSAVATAYRIVHESAASLASLGVAVDPLLQAALDMALAKHAEDRFATAASFADTLAPIAPDGATRREALRDLVEAAVGMSAAAVPHAVAVMASRETAAVDPTGEDLAASKPEGADADGSAQTPLPPEASSLVIPVARPAATPTPRVDGLRPPPQRPRDARARAGPAAPTERDGDAARAEPHRAPAPTELRGARGASSTRRGHALAPRSPGGAERVPGCHERAPGVVRGPRTRALGVSDPGVAHADVERAHPDAAAASPRAEQPRVPPGLGPA